jgi:serine/threonine protein kinase
VRPFGPGRRLAPGVHVVAHLHRSNVLDAYDAWCVRRACRVVVKTLRPDRRDDARAARALRAEGRRLQRLAHPHLVRAYAVHDGPPPVVIMETLGGETLAALLERRGRLPAAELRILGSQLASAMAYLHGERLLHLDLKPSNVVAAGGLAKVLDLSIAGPPGHVRAGRGTWCNMAPEQARGGHVGPAADAWGIGTVLYEAACGANPFADLDELEYPQLHHRAAPVRAHRRLPPDLAGLIDACLERQPADRPSAEDLVKRLAP